METQVIKIDSRTGGSEAARRAAEVLKAGGLIGFPTETVYGLGARADRKDAMQRLRKVKQRSQEQAFTVHVAAGSEAERFAPNLSPLARRLIRKGWPGPLTLIVAVDDPGSAPVMAGLNGSAAAAMYYHKTVGLRCPDDRIAQTMLREVGAPVVASSANVSGRPAPKSGFEVLRDLGGKIDLLIDAGRTKYSLASTIVEITGPTYQVVREGVLDAGIVQRLASVRLLFVCTGNTCRSPMAAGLAKRLLAERMDCTVDELESRGVIIQSAGTSGGIGPATEHAVAVMGRRGIDISDHASTVLSAEMIQQADYVFAMTHGHLERILELSPRAKESAMLLKDGKDIADPMGSAEESYEECARVIEEGLRRRLEELPV